MSGIFLGLALMSSPAEAGDTSNETPPSKPHLLRRIAPVGGWDPDGLGMFHWWKPNCFGLNRNPDDYCRSPFRDHSARLARPQAAIRISFIIKRHKGGSSRGNGRIRSHHSIASPGPRSAADPAQAGADLLEPGSGGLEGSC